ncbi:MAG: hypothetical protein ACJ8FY_26245 [Gemmataceae bacterium]
MSQLIASSLPILIRLAGIGQLVLIVASLAIPRVLGWKEETAKLRPLTRQVFWTYAGYIWAINLAFGLLSALAPSWLLDHSGLAAAATSFIGVYWIARLVIQFTYFDRHDVKGRAPPAFLIGGEAALVGLFSVLSLIYTLAALWNLGVIAA